MIINLNDTDIFPNDAISIIYDDGCPVCSYYISISRIEEKFGKVNLIKARNNEKILDYLKLVNINVNEGMIVVFDKKIYFGPDAVNIMSILGKKDSFINSIIINVFQYRIVSQIFYPLLKLGRRLLLFILGKKLI
tara:strand:+ start:555 stop:959 length:405 start_codon:yes stop_codon:yes gene_type:complete